MLAYCLLESWEHFSNIQINTTDCIQENKFANIVCEMVAFLSRPKYFKNTLEQGTFLLTWIIFNPIMDK